MRSLLCALVLLVTALPLRAEERSFDLGFAHPGMEQSQFRAGQWADGRVICSNDADYPPEVEFTLPKGVARVGAVRCGLYSQDQAAHWHIMPAIMAGWPGEVWAMFIPDEAGALRLVQLKLVLPEAAFDDLAQSWGQLFGLPSFRRDQVVHWTNARNDAAIIGDSGGGAYVHAYLLDNALHTSANRRLGQMPARH
ncbi:hypothetical protein [Magnetospirillum sulfuroxidans]|uniref:Uncharacterized protein n=1 Tax=Magnetospirillum sulfuroxidans TaxID=611300 RepID=A0ABS5IEX9_9PROT|nr:hypothetical protein [Magnetospirillum sulfuroxidans]MBR9972971.1 hypothetical protein [Magnetospirillum sulfuroxidans]